METVKDNKLKKKKRKNNKALREEEKKVKKSNEGEKKWKEEVGNNVSYHREARVTSGLIHFCWFLQNTQLCSTQASERWLIQDWGWLGEEEQKEKEWGSRRCRENLNVVSVDPGSRREECIGEENDKKHTHHPQH